MADRPELLPGLQVVWEAFWVLSRSRQTSGMGGASGLLPSEIIAYLSWAGVQDRDDQDVCFSYILALDGAYLKHLSDELKKKEQTR